MERFTGIVVVLLSIWEFYTVYGAFKAVKKVGTTSRFLPLALWSGTFLGIVFLGIGIRLILNGY
ncbi:immunity protein [Lactobacillus sp. ESL0681]|uniref:immunity protein n=1 Tax=Lactobacillus sp. ESL0681 TaxID=2983211 RepID=UPI0023F83DE4|nr:immunity protein [Lactobacillus sp. ESL0681]WEV39818.1 immunity protein [Lactobacillus sp. ESL0681]